MIEMWFLIKVKSGKDVGVDEMLRYLLNEVAITNSILTSERRKIEATGVAVHPATPDVPAPPKAPDFSLEYRAHPNIYQNTTVTTIPPEIIHIHDNRDNEPHRTLCGDYVRPMPTLELTDHEQSNCPECKTLARILLAKPEEK